MRLFSWNVNGIRAVERKGFLSWLQSERPEVLCLQEVRAEPEQLSHALREGHGYHVVWNPAQKKGYSGVATFSLTPPDEVSTELGEARFDEEGRVIRTRHGRVILYNVYFPNGGREHARVPYKTDFYRALLKRAQVDLATGAPVVICGDFNTAHQPIDLARPQANVKTSGFLPEERALVDEYLKAGFADAFRVLYPLARERYSWWSNRQGARGRNIGWRIDYHLISRAHLGEVIDARIHDKVLGSDHCPVELELGQRPEVTP